LRAELWHTAGVERVTHNPEPELSVVIGSTEPWSHMRPGVERVAQAARRVGGDVVLAMSHAEGLPADEAGGLPAGVRVVVVPGASVFALRAAGLAEARGRVVVVTEDHCEFPSDWLEQVLRAHAEHPSAAGVAGPVRNCTGACAIDWANFYMSYAPFAGGRWRERPRRVPPAANVSLKRWAIPASGGAFAEGYLEFHLLPELWLSGKVAYVDAVAIEHGQSHGFFNAFGKHFHNGRASSGLWARSGVRPPMLARLGAALTAPGRIVRESLEGVRLAGEPAGRVRMAMPLLVGLALCHTLGELVGLAIGPGQSPMELK
jgi:hypothetical protein